MRTIIYIWKNILPNFIKFFINYILLIWKTWKLKIDKQSYYYSSPFSLIRWDIDIDRTVTWGFNINIKWKIKIDKYTNISWPNTYLLWCYDYKIKIWKFCSIAPNVTIISSNWHDYNKLTISPQSIFPIVEDIWWDVIIWNDVWIWSNVVILPGVKIGNWVIIWAWSIITKNIEPYKIVVWNPWKVIKNRFNKNTIDKLEKLKWWNWNLEKIKENYNIISIINSKDI
jgi:acetyltransferase-like isoleucine patch superfamily enzyme